MAWGADEDWCSVRKWRVLMDGRDGDEEDVYMCAVRVFDGIYYWDWDWAWVVI